MTPLPWIVMNVSIIPSTQVCRFGTRADAEMHAQSLNRLTKTTNYKAIYSLQ